jgi:hypothetical protein
VPEAREPVRGRASVLLFFSRNRLTYFDCAAQSAVAQYGQLPITKVHVLWVIVRTDAVQKEVRRLSGRRDHTCWFPNDWNAFDSGSCQVSPAVPRLENCDSRSLLPPFWRSIKVSVSSYGRLPVESLNGSPPCHRDPQSI